MSERQRVYLHIKPADLKEAIELLNENPHVPEEDFVEINMEGTIDKLIRVHARDPYHLREICTTLTTNGVECFELIMRHIYVPYVGAL